MFYFFFRREEAGGATQSEVTVAHALQTHARRPVCVSSRSTTLLPASHQQVLHNSELSTVEHISATTTSRSRRSCQNLYRATGTRQYALGPSPSGYQTHTEDTPEAAAGRRNIPHSTAGAPRRRSRRGSRRLRRFRVAACRPTAGAQLGAWQHLRRRRLDLHRLTDDIEYCRGRTDGWRTENADPPRIGWSLDIGSFPLGFVVISIFVLIFMTLVKVVVLAERGGRYERAADDDVSGSSVGGDGDGS